MSNLNAGDWFAEKVRFEQQETILGNITFPIIPLDDDHLESIQLADTYSEMIDIAVLNGMASGDSRVCDNPRMDAYYAEFWEKHDGEPSIKNQLGEFICDISGLSEIVADAYDLKVEAEEAAKAAKIAEEAANYIKSEGVDPTLDDADLDGVPNGITSEQLESHATTYNPAV